VPYLKSYRYALKSSTIKYTVPGIPGPRNPRNQVYCPRNPTESQAIDYLKDHPDITVVRFVLFDSGTYRAYEEAMQELDTQD